MLGRDRELVETLLQERSAGLKRTRVAMRYRALDASSEVVAEPLPPPQEPPSASTCSECGGAIPAARLKAIPTAVRCTPCQLQFESQTL